MRDPWLTIRVQQCLRSGAAAKVDDPDKNMRENFSGIGPRLAGAGHNPGQLFAETGTFIGIGRTKARAVAERSPCQAAIIGACNDGAAADFLAQDAPHDAMPGL